MAVSSVRIRVPLGVPIVGFRGLGFRVKDYSVLGSILGSPYLEKLL